MKRKESDKTNIAGLSLVEILVVITVFAVLGIIISSSLILTMRGTQKSESSIKVRENLNYAVAVVERNLRNADSITDCGVSDDISTIGYVDQYGTNSSFSCIGVGEDNSFVASGSARLTPESIEVIDCSFICTESTSSNPPVVTFDLAIKDTSDMGTLNSTVSTELIIYLRN